jgi:hypothetical protein
MILDKLHSLFISKKYYILRSNTFAQSANVKILYTVFALILCYGNIEYFQLYLMSTGCWTIVEFLLQKLHIRQIGAMVLKTPTHYLNDVYVEKHNLNKYINKQYIIPHYLAILLQGSMECGFIMIFGLFFADRLKEQYMLMFVVLICIFSNTMWLSSNTYSDILNDYFSSPVYKQFLNRKIVKINKITYTSKRLINAKIPLIVLFLAVIYDIYGYLYIEFLRPFKMLFIMVLLGYVWTLAQVLMETRLVVTNDNNPVTKLESLAVLSFDVIVEIGLAYMPFYFILKSL